MVRSARPGRDTKILLQLCTNTYNAYNNWGGSSLYGGPKGPARRVSFERPYVGFVPGDRFTSRYSGWRNWEQPFVAWAEAAGYRLDFAVNSDLEFRPEILKGYRLVLSVGHDEYWSAPMRDHLEAFIGAGGNVGLLQRQYLLLAGPHRGPGPRPGELEDGLRPGPGLQDGRPSAAERHVEQPPRRAAGEPADRRQLRLRRLPPLLRARRRRLLHRPPAGPLDLRRHRPASAAIGWGRRTRSSATSATAASSPWRTACRCPPTATAPRRRSRSWGPRRPGSA